MKLIPENDFDWLGEVHGVSAEPGNVVFLHGTEDCPDKVEVYDYDHVDAPKVVYELKECDDDGFTDGHPKLVRCT